MFTSQGTGAVSFMPLDLAIVEALKLACNVILQCGSGESLFPKLQVRTTPWDASQEVEEQPLRDLADRGIDENAVSSSEDLNLEPGDANFTMRSCLAVMCASAVWAVASYTVRGLTDRTKNNR
jgi:hypothetical protein